MMAKEKQAEDTQVGTVRSRYHTNHYTAHVNAQMSEDMRKQVEDYAKQRDMSLCAVMRVCVRDFFLNEDLQNMQGTPT